MSKIRVNQLCKQFNVAPEELVAFLQTQGKTIEPIPNAKVPDSYIHALQKQFGTDDNPKDGAKDVSSHSKEPIVQVPQQGKAQLITDLCNRNEVPLENLAQTVGQPQWLIDSTMQGKVTNDVTVAAIVGRLLQTYRKKLDCELKDAEKATLVSREQLKQWEAGQKIDFDRVEGYLDNLAKYAKSKKEKPAPLGKVLTPSNVENKPVKGADKSKKKSKSTKSRKRKIDWGLYEVSVYAKEQKERQNRQKEWEESRKKALELMAGARQLPEAPKLYPEPSFLKEANEKYERGKIIESLKEQLLTLALAYSEEEITNERLQHALGMHRADITLMLSKMCAKKLLESAGYGRGTKYHVYGMNVALPDANVALPDANVALPDTNVALPDTNVALPDANVGLTDPNVGLQDPNVELIDGNVGLPNANVGLHRKRYSKNELRELVLSFCTQWRTAEEIAFYIDRNLVYVKNRVLPQMSDVIEKMYDIPHHPRQKYRAKQQKESEE